MMYNFSLKMDQYFMYIIINCHIIYDDLGFYIYNSNQMYSIGFFSIFEFLRQFR